MKELNTNSIGRMPLWQKDLDWMQQSYQEMFAALVSELNMDDYEYFAITGVVPTKSGKWLDAQKGWVWYNGEILPVKSALHVDVSSMTDPVVKLTRVTSYNSDGARNFIKPDMTTHNVTNVWQDDYLQPAVIEREAAIESGELCIAPGAWTMSEIIAKHADAFESDWIYTHSGDLSFKRVGSLVVLNGVATNVRTDTQEVDEGLPAPLGGRAQIKVADSQNDMSIWVDNLGKLHCYSQGGQGEPILTGLMYMAATSYTANDPNVIIPD